MVNYKASLLCRSKIEDGLLLVDVGLFLSVSRSFSVVLLFLVSFKKFFLQFYPIYSTSREITITFTFLPATYLFLYPLKTPENLWFSDVFRGVYEQTSNNSINTK